MDDDVVVIGAGLAGLAASAALATRGFRVQLLESKNRLGGRAGSFTDPQTGQLLDACQHVSMGCCTNLAHLARTVGIAGYLEPQPCLYFMTPDGKVSRLQADTLPAPFHLARSFLRAHYLTLGEKLRVAYGLACLRLAGPRDDPPFLDWLRKHWQTPRTIERFWGIVLVSALNELPDKIGLRYARKVFVDGFMRHRRGFEVEVPSVPLGRLYGEELQSWLEGHGVQVRLNTGVRRIVVNNGNVQELELRDGSTLRANWYVATVPFDRLLDLLPTDVASDHTYFSNLKGLTHSPITSVHLWFDRQITELPHVVLLDSVGQWVFNRGQVEPGEYYLQVVISAAGRIRDMGNEAAQELVVCELRRLFPQAKEARLLRGRVITEHAATFSVVPEVDRWRPEQGSPVGNLLVAGDWTATGWPATMEGAVRSGYLAAEALLKRKGIEERIVQPDL